MNEKNEELREGFLSQEIEEFLDTLLGSKDGDIYFTRNLCANDIDAVEVFLKKLKERGDLKKNSKLFFMISCLNQILLLKSSGDPTMIELIKAKGEKLKDVISPFLAIVAEKLTLDREEESSTEEQGEIDSILSKLKTGNMRENIKNGIKRVLKPRRKKKKEEA